MTVTAILLTVGFGGIFGWNVLRGYFINSFFANFEPPPVTISAVQAQEKTWQLYLKAVGSFVASSGVDISSEAAGIVKAINFSSGEEVEQGKVLIQLDDSVEQAVLKDNLAELSLTKLNYQRQRDLSKRGATANSIVDEAQAKLSKAEAAVARTQALIQQKTIRAPFGGKIGIRFVNLGQFISPGSANKLVTLQALDPLYIQFSLPEQFLQKIYVSQPVALQVEAFGKTIFQGRISAIDAKVDSQTHNFLAQAMVANKDHRLYPGMFADLKIMLPQQNKVITLPSTAIAYTLYGNSVFVIKEEGKDKEGKPILRAYRQFVSTGEQRDGEVMIVDGLKAGDLVVDSGQLKLQNGTRVAVDNTVKPERLIESVSTEES